MFKCVRILYLLIVLGVLLCFSACTADNSVNIDVETYAFLDYFTVIETGVDPVTMDEYKIMYANDTKVKYLLVDGYRSYAITPLYNADGTLQVYTENKESR